MTARCSPPRNIFPEYHAHVYFDEQTVEQARVLDALAGEQRGVGLLLEGPRRAETGEY